MELWMIWTKLTLVSYIAFYYVHDTIRNMSWVVFFILLYLCVNMLIYLMKKPYPQKGMILFSILVTLFSYFMVQPLFCLLLPINIYELVSTLLLKKWQVVLCGFIPILFLKENTLGIYGLIAILSFLIFIMTERHMERVLYYESQTDTMRKDMQKLTKNLHENKEYIRQSEYTFKLEERNRLSQEIHDKIGHSMTGALIQMEAAKRLMELDLPKASQLLQNAIDISKEGIEDIRHTLKNMKPTMEQLGLSRMKLFLDEFSAQHNLRILFTHKGNMDMIIPIQWKVIQENVTEALTNTLKYAEAFTVTIEIQVLNKFVKVVVKDNGKGAVKIKKGLGIIGMEERAAALNGKVIVDGSNGFSVTTLVPIDEKLHQ